MLPPFCWLASQTWKQLITGSPSPSLQSMSAFWQWHSPLPNQGWPHSPWTHVLFPCHAFGNRSDGDIDHYANCNGCIMGESSEDEPWSLFPAGLLYSLSFHVESGILLAMIHDRFIAIHNPLRYTSILSNTRVVKLAMGAFMRGFISIVPVIVRLFFISILPLSCSLSCFLSSPRNYETGLCWHNL